SFSSRFQAPDAIDLLRRNTPPTRRVPALRSSFASSRLDATGQPLRHLGRAPARTPKFSNYFEFLDLYGSKLAARWSIQPRQGLRPSALWSRVSSDRVDLMGKYVRVPAIRVSNISGGKHSVSLCHKGSSSSSIDANTSMRHTQSKPDEAPTVEPVNGKMSMDIHVQTEAVNTIKRSAKIHDFCLGIPFGRFHFAGALLGYIFSRNPTGMVSGGVILALSFFSLKVWRTGRSSLPFISDQAGLYSSAPMNFLRIIFLDNYSSLIIFLTAGSVAMICFYSYVLISGGNPPPKKLAAAPNN
ncbi:unnamed protein product, partial [Musa acuminata subsp. burmannicoides]